MANDGRAAVQLLVDKVAAVTKHYFASFQATQSLYQLTKKHPEIEAMFRGEDVRKPSTHERELLRDAHQYGLDINEANHLLMPAIDEALSALTTDVVTTITDARVVPEPVQWAVNLRQNLSNLMNVALWPWESERYSVQGRCDKGYEISQAIDPLVHWLHIGAPGLKGESVAPQRTSGEGLHSPSSESGGAGMPSISTIPCERTIQAGQAGKGAVGYAFAHYVQNIVIAIVKARDVLQEPPPAWGTDTDGNPVRASRDFAINNALSQIKSDAHASIDAWHGNVLADAERGGYVTAIREEMKDIERALYKLLESGAHGDSYPLYFQAHRAVARAERVVWALVDALPIDTAPESDPFYPAAYFEQFNVTGDMLRQAIKKDENGDAKIRSKKPAGRNFYSFNDAKKIWPHLMAQAKRDNA